MTPWKTISRRTVLQHGPFLTVEMHAVQLPEGRIISDWPWLITPDFVLVLAQRTDGLFLCFRQTKYALADTSLAPVGGIIEPGELPLDAARRELLEETGYSSAHWTSLGAYPVDPNRGAGNAHLFLARDATLAASPLAADLEEQELLLLTLPQLQLAFSQGQFKALPWTALIASALIHLSQEKE